MNAEISLPFDGLRRLARGLRTHPFGRRRPFQSVGRMVAWQVRSRLSPGPHRVEFINGTTLWARSGETGVTGNIYYGLHEFEDMAFIAHALRPDDHFADIGANAGTYTVIAAGAAGARVTAVEPVPTTVERLRANIALNAIADRVRIEICALTDKAGKVRFTTSQDTVNRITSAIEEAGAIDVPARAFDELFADDLPCIAKIDIEGHEAKMLRGASGALNEPGLWALIVEVANNNLESVGAMLGRHGFEPLQYDPYKRLLTPRSDRNSAGNILFLRSEALDTISERLRSAPAFTIHGERI